MFHNKVCFFQFLSVLSGLLIFDHECWRCGNFIHFYILHDFILIIKHLYVTLYTHIYNVHTVFCMRVGSIWADTINLPLNVIQRCHSTRCTQWTTNIRNLILCIFTSLVRNKRVHVFAMYLNYLVFIRLAIQWHRQRILFLNLRFRTGQRVRRTSPGPTEIHQNHATNHVSL